MIRTRLVALLIACCTCTAVAQAAGDSLYQSFGRKEGLRLLMEDFFDRLLVDPRTQPFFKDASRKRVVEQLTEQLCAESGGPCVYAGDPMEPVHKGPKIGKQDFNALVEVLQEAMEAKGIPFGAQNGMLARLAPMHRQIITR